VSKNCTFYCIYTFFLQEKAVEAIKQKEEKRKKPKPGEQEGMPQRQHCPPEKRRGDIGTHSAMKSSRKTLHEIETFAFINVTLFVSKNCAYALNMNVILLCPKTARFAFMNVILFVSKNVRYYFAFMNVTLFASQNCTF
jgi:hypothetical protein